MEEINKMYETEHERGLPESTDLEVVTDMVKQLTVAVQYLTEVMNAQLVTSMRLYDVNMALLESQDSDLADSVYESHERNELRNPDILIPTED